MTTIVLVQSMLSMQIDRSHYKILVNKRRLLSINIEGTQIYFMTKIYLSTEAAEMNLNTL